MTEETISILDGSTFVVSDRRGDVEATLDSPHGLFYGDTRFLSRWKLTVNGVEPDVLSTENIDYFAAQFFLVPPSGTIYQNPYLSVIRKRAVGGGFHEDVSVLNHGGEVADVELRVEAGADFADLFEVKDALEKRGETYAEVRGNELVPGYCRDDFVRETRVTATADAELSPGGLVFMPPKSEWTTCIEVRPVADGAVGRVKYSHGTRQAKPNIGESLEQWLRDAPKVESDWDPVAHIRRRSLVDLAALRFYPDDALPGASVPAAGLPWFMALLGSCTSCASAS